MDKSITLQLERVKDLYQIWQINEEALASKSALSSKGNQAASRRNQVFLKEKIKSALNNIKQSMQVTLFEVHLTNRQGVEYTLLLNAETEKDIRIYMDMLQVINHESYIINHIERIPTIYQGHITFSVK